ncbi:STAS domain-containing protein [Nonomuraea sp. NPDC050663]|uniref:STAS domain-containing protein n=1 Tax=Nonomuraea sp. NPDC050663 TaxID=3364370 RepID=UPI00379098C4
MGLRIEIHSVDDTALLLVAGEFDISSTSHLMMVVAATRAPHVRLSLSHVTFMDAAGLTALVRIAHRTESLVLLDPAPCVMRLLELTRMHNHFAYRWTDLAHFTNAALPSVRSEDHHTPAGVAVSQPR